MKIKLSLLKKMGFHTQKLKKTELQALLLPFTDCMKSFLNYFRRLKFLFMMLKKIISYLAWAVLGIALVRFGHLLTIVLRQSGDIMSGVNYGIGQLYQPTVIWALLLIVSRIDKGND